MAWKTVKARPDLRFALSLSLITLLAPVATDMYLASMAEIARHLQVTYASVQLTLMVFLLAQGAGQLVFGPLVDRYGRRVPLLIGVAVFAVSSLWAGSSPNIGHLLASRFIQGLSGALLLVIGFSSVRDVTEGTAAARLFAVLLTIEGLAPIFAPIIGGYIAEYLGWRAVLYASAVMAVFAFGNAWLSLPETLPQEKRLVLNARDIVSTYVRILKDSGFLLPTLALSGAFFFLFAYISGGAYLYQEIFGLSPDQFGLVFGITGGTVLLGASASGRYVKTVSAAKLAIMGICCIIAGTAVAFVSAFSVGMYGMVPGFMVAMFGFGMAEPTLVSLTMASQRQALGFTAALMGALHLMLSSVSTPVSGSLLPMSMAYWFLFLLAAAGVTLALAVATMRHEKAHTAHHKEAVASPVSA